MSPVARATSAATVPLTTRDALRVHGCCCQSASDTRVTMKHPGQRARYRVCWGVMRYIYLRSSPTALAKSALRSFAALWLDFGGVSGTTFLRDTLDFVLTLHTCHTCSRQLGKMTTPLHAHCCHITDMGSPNSSHRLTSAEMVIATHRLIHSVLAARSYTMQSRPSVM